METKQVNDSAVFPESIVKHLARKQVLRYGENPHQRAALYVEADAVPTGIASACQLQGKELSYNNFLDADAAVRCVSAFNNPTCVIVKHANPCGVATAGTVRQAYVHAHAADPTSAFGGIIAFNSPLDKLTAEAIVERQFAEVIAAPTIHDDALPPLCIRPNIRVLAGWTNSPKDRAIEWRTITGGWLLQEEDQNARLLDGFRTVTERHTDSLGELADLLFAWKVVEFVKSNAIVLARNLRTTGIGPGQPNRAMSVRIACEHARKHGPVTRTVLASDAFFPFRDGIDAAREAGVTAIIQPGGSQRDQEVIDAANEHGMALIFTGIRHFRH